jgi:hypothetical protein
MQGLNCEWFPSSRENSRPLRYAIEWNKMNFGGIYRRYSKYWRSAPNVGTITNKPKEHPSLAECKKMQMPVAESASRGTSGRRNHTTIKRHRTLLALPWTQKPTYLTYQPTYAVLSQVHSILPSGCRIYLAMHRRPAALSDDGIGGHLHPAQNGTGSHANPRSPLRSNYNVKQSPKSGSNT